MTMKMVKTTTPTRLSKFHNIDLVEFGITTCHKGDKIKAVFIGDKENKEEWLDFTRWSLPDHFSDNGIFYEKKEDDFVKLDWETNEFFNEYLSAKLTKNESSDYYFSDIDLRTNNDPYAVEYTVEKDFYVVEYLSATSLNLPSSFYAHFQNEYENCGTEYIENDLPQMLKDLEKELPEEMKGIDVRAVNSFYYNKYVECYSFSVPTLWSFHIEQWEEPDYWMEYEEIFSFEKLMAKKDAT